jgi:uncharacterized protein
MRGIFIAVLFCHCFWAIGQEKEHSNGYVKFTYPNGKISSEGVMINGKPDGYWKTYYVNGIIKSEGNRKNFLLDSIWSFYNEMGDTLERISFVLGKKNGYYFKYKSVVEKNATQKIFLESRELYVNDKKEGLAYYYFPNGNLFQTIHYRNNKKHGEGKEYDKNGTLIAILEYFNDYLIDKQNLNRVVKGSKEGVWKEFYDNGKLKSEKKFVNNQLDGYVREYNQDGTLKLKEVYNQGKLLDNLKEDTLNIEERITYDENKRVKKKGYYKSNVPVGIHREYDSDGKVINAYVYDEEGHIVSQGIVNDDGTREGKWNYFFENGEIKSEGLYKNNRQSGEWKFLFKGGKPEQVGKFENGFFSGEWSWFYPNGSKLRIESFTQGKREGKFIEFSEKGDTTTFGSYTEGEMNGFWRITSGDTREEGSYTNDLREGIWKSFYEDGKLMYQGNYIQGNPDGKHVYYYPDGKIQEEQVYVLGIKEKNWYKFTPEGHLFLTITYQSDIETKINGIKIDRKKK